MSAVTTSVGVFILHNGIAILTATPVLRPIDVVPEVKPVLQGLLIVAIGVLLIAAGGKVLALAIERVLFPERISLEELWVSLTPSLKRRLRFTVSKGYSKVLVKDDDFLEVMGLEKQKHVRFVGNKGGVVAISQDMYRHIESLPEEPPAPVRSSFYDPTPSFMTASEATMRTFTPAPAVPENMSLK